MHYAPTTTISMNLHGSRPQAWGGGGWCVSWSQRSSTGIILTAEGGGCGRQQNVQDATHAWGAVRARGLYELLRQSYLTQAASYDGAPREWLFANSIGGKQLLHWGHSCLRPSALACIGPGRCPTVCTPALPVVLNQCTAGRVVSGNVPDFACIAKLILDVTGGGVGGQVVHHQHIAAVLLHDGRWSLRGRKPEGGSKENSWLGGGWLAIVVHESQRLPELPQAA